jgi:hypothetical protein
LSSSSSSRRGQTSSSSSISGEERMHWNGAPGKWIANHWIEASDIPGEDEEHSEDADEFIANYSIYYI